MSDTPITDSVRGILEHVSFLEIQLTESKLAYEAAHSELVRANQDLARCRESCSQLRKELDELKKGEFICGKCGIRKDSEHTKGDF